MHKKDRYSYLYNGKSDSVLHFSVKFSHEFSHEFSHHFQNEHLSPFSDKRDEKVVRGKTYRLKLEFYNTERKMKIHLMILFLFSVSVVELEFQQISFLIYHFFIPFIRKWTQVLILTLFFRILSSLIVKRKILSDFPL